MAQGEPGITRRQLPATLGQKLRASSLGVTLSTEDAQLLQDIIDAINAVDISVDNLTLEADQIDLNTDAVEALLADIKEQLPGSFLDAGNTITTPLGSSAVFTGTWTEVEFAGSILFLYAITPETEAPASVVIQWSDDGSTVKSLYGTTPLASQIVTSNGFTYAVYLYITNTIGGKFYRAVVTNGAVAQTSSPIGYAGVQRYPFAGSFTGLNDALSLISRALLVRAVQAGENFDGEFVNLQLPEHTVDIENSTDVGLTNGAQVAFTVDDTTDRVLSTAHGLVDGDAVVLTTTGTLPAPLTHSTTVTTATPEYEQETVYWVINATADDFQLTSEIVPVSALPTPIDISGTGSGTHTYQKRGQFVGVFKDYSQVGHGLDFFFDLQRPALLRSEWSTDGIDVGSDAGDLFVYSVRPLRAISVTEPVPATYYVGIAVQQTMISKYRRVRLVNGPNDQFPSLHALDTFIGKANYPGTFLGLEDSLSELSTALLTRAVIAGVSPDGSFVNNRQAGRDPSNSTTTPLDADGVYRGTWFPWQGDYVKLVSDLSADVPGTFYIDFSEEVAPTDGDDSSITGDPMVVDYDPDLGLYRRHTPVQSRWVRHRYVNGDAAQAEFALDGAFVTSDPGSTAQGLRRVPERRTMAEVVRNIPALPTGDGTAYQEVPVDTDGIPYAHITDIDDDILLRPLPTARTTQVTINASDPVQLDDPPMVGRRSVAIANMDDDNDAVFGFDPDTLTDNTGFDFPARRTVTLMLSEDQPIYGLVVGAATNNTQVLDGTGSSGTATNPSNARFDDGSYANIASGQLVDITTYSIAPTLAAVAQVKLRLIGKKQASQFQTVAMAEHQFTSGANVGSLASPSLAGGTAQCYVAAISRYNNGTVTGVTGLGLTWVLVDTYVDDQTHGALDLWVAVGDATAGAVTATFSTLAGTCHIAVTRFTGVDQTTPVEDFDHDRGNNTSAVSTPALNGTNKGYRLTAIEEHQRTNTPGGGATELSDQNGAAAGNDGLAVQGLALTSTGSSAPSSTLSGGAHWVAVALTLSPAAAIDPSVTLSYELSNVPGATSQDITLSSITDTTFDVDITADRVWAFTDIANMEVIATALTIGDATADIDALNIVVVETSGSTVRVSVMELA